MNFHAAVRASLLIGLIRFGGYEAMYLVRERLGQVTEDHDDYALAFAAVIDDDAFPMEQRTHLTLALGGLAGNRAANILLRLINLGESAGLRRAAWWAIINRDDPALLACLFQSPMAWLGLPKVMIKYSYKHLSGGMEN